MFWEMYQQRQIYSAQESASRASSKADQVSMYVSQMDDKIESLALVCQSMWELLSAEIPDAEQKLAERIQEVDLRDGRLDGKLGRIETHCRECNRPLHKRHRRCLYCGESLEQEHLFQR